MFQKKLKSLYLLKFWNDVLQLKTEPHVKQIFLQWTSKFLPVDDNVPSALQES